MLEMAQSEKSSNEGRDDHEEIAGVKSEELESKPIELELSFVGEDEETSGFIFLTSEGEIHNSNSSLTASDVSHNPSDASFGSFCPIPFHEGNPKERNDGAEMSIGDQLEPTCFPYAQLCFDPESKTLVTLMEVNMKSATGGRQSKRIRMVEANYNMEETKREAHKDPNTSGTDSTVSLYWEDDRFGIVDIVDAKASMMRERYNEPIVFSTEPSQSTWFEEAELDLYLLHDCQDPWEMDGKAQCSCSEALKKLLLASKSLVVFRPRRFDHDLASHWNQVSQESFSGIGYSFLQEV